MSIDIIQASTQKEVECCLEIRKKVFIEEQGVPANIEQDDYDHNSIHFLASLDSLPVATARIRIVDNALKFERIATPKEARGKGIASSLLQFMLEYAKKKYPNSKIWMNAQESAIGFYEKLG